MKEIKNKILLSLILPVVFLVANPLAVFVAAQEADPNFCAPEIYAGAPIYPITYDYGPDGLVRFHFTLTADWGGVAPGYLYGNEACDHLWGATYHDFSGMGLWTEFIGIRHLLMKAAVDDLGRYYWEAYDEDTMQPYPIVGMPPPFSHPFASLWFANPGYGSPWAESAFVRVRDYNYRPKTPVLIVPGILGTELQEDGDLIWPDLAKEPGADDLILFDHLDLDNNGDSILNIDFGNAVEKILDIPLLNVNIFEELKLDLQNLSNYEVDQNLFFFPYDWRLDLENTKDLLNAKIEEIKLQTGSPNVDIIAHSMGGLLTKAYINSYGKDSVRKLIFLGTPQLGAPKAGKVIVKGDKFDIIWLDSDRVEEVAKNSPALHQLIPNQAYFNHYQGYIKPFKFFGNPSFYDYQQTKDFYLNEEDKNPIMFQKAEDFFAKNLQDLDLSGIDAYNIAGCKTSTQSAYRLSAFGGIGGVGYSSGDGTVPLVSADYINIPPLHKYYVKNANHSELPSTGGVRELILDILNGTAPTLENNVSGFSDFCNFKGKTLTWRSPVEVHIYDTQGRHTGPIENNGIEFGIPGVDYDVIDGEKFIFLPTDEGQEYQINTIGEAQGTFDLLISENDNGNDQNTFVYNDVPIEQGIPIAFDISEISEDGEIAVNNQTMPADSQLPPGQAGDVTPPATTATVNGTAGNSGWHKSSVEASLNATDGESGILNTYYKLETDLSYQPYLGSISLTAEGDHVLEYYSVDNAGNNEAVQSIEIKIDKISPEFKTGFNLNPASFVFSAVDNLDSNPVINCSLVLCEAQDEAGNISKLNFAQSKILSIYSLSLKNQEQNGGIFEFPENLLITNYFTSKGVLKDIDQVFLLKKQQIAIADYNKKKNVSSIVELAGGGLKKYTLPGIHYLEILTNKNNLSINIK